MWRTIDQGRRKNNTLNNEVKRYGESAGRTRWHGWLLEGVREVEGLA